MDGASPSDEFSIYDSIVYEVERELKLYVLSRGEWFEINQDYIRSIISELAGIPDHLALNLSDARPDEPESNYHRRAVDESQGVFALLDRQVIQYGRWTQFDRDLRSSVVEQGFHSCQSKD